jgi:hypothetical protein
VEDICQGKVEPTQLFNSHHELWPLVGLRGSHVSCCQVFPLQGCKLVQISATLSKISDGLIFVFKCSDSISYYYVNYEDDVDYSVVMA